MVARHWDLYTETGAEYEQPADVLHRVQTYIHEVRYRYPTGRVVAVTHGDIIAFTILWAKGAPVTFAQKQNLSSLGIPDNYPAYASITEIRFASPDTNIPDTLSYTNPVSG